MTIEEAIKGIHTLTDRISLADDRQDAIAMAIKSLEAWEKVKNDICEIDWYGDDVFWDGVNLVSDIIDKHLSEVSE